MELEKILKMESIGEAELKVLTANLHKLSDSDKVKFGFMEAPVVAEKPKTIKSKK